MIKNPVMKKMKNTKMMKGRTMTKRKRKTMKENLVIMLELIEMTLMTTTMNLRLKTKTLILKGERRILD